MITYRLGQKLGFDIPANCFDSGLRIVRYGLIHLESFWEDGDYMKMESLQQNL